jgi:hypothetical protein
MVGLAFVLMIAGAQPVLRSSSLTGLVASTGVTAAELSLVAATLETIPPLRDWFKP